MSKTILIVEDDLLLLSMYKVKFLNDGFEVVEAQNGKAGLECFRQSKPDLVLTDWMMPVMSGAEMVKAIRADGGKDVPVVVFSNTMLDRDRWIAKKLGVKSFLSKADNTPALLTKEIRKLLD